MNTQEQINAKIQAKAQRNAEIKQLLNDFERQTHFPSLNLTEGQKSINHAFAVMGGVDLKPNKEEIKRASINMLNKKEKTDLNLI